MYKQVRLSAETYARLKIYSRDNNTTLAGAIQQLLNQDSERAVDVKHLKTITQNLIEREGLFAAQAERQDKIEVLLKTLLLKSNQKEDTQKTEKLQPQAESTDLKNKIFDIDRMLRSLVKHKFENDENYRELAKRKLNVLKNQEL